MPASRPEYCALEPDWLATDMYFSYTDKGVPAGEGFAVVARDTLFADTYQFAGNPHANYDVMADGSHFVFLKAASEGSMIVVTNWTSVVRSRMATRSAK